MIKPIPTLTSSRLILRGFMLTDAADVFDYAKNEEVAKYVFWHAHKTINDSTNFIKETIQEYQKENKLIWAIQLKDNDKVIGVSGFIFHNLVTKSLKIGYALNPEYWHKGYSKEALQTMIDYAFNNLDIIRIEGVSVDKNTASEKLMLSCDMIFEGILHDGFIKDNEIHDCKLFAITKRNYFKNIK